VIWEFVHLSKPAFKETNALVKTYQDRLKRDIRFECLYVKDEVRLAQHLKISLGFTIFLDERGKNIDSIALSKKLTEWRAGPHKTIRFCVGDSHGFSENARSQANWLWRLSDLTLPGDFAWLLLWEQIFRGFAILRKTGYHH
jgi:23S rRNA pseudoU1915 N3-methylase RlmH